MTISETVPGLGTPPSIADPANFDTRADTLFGTTLPALVTSINTWAGQANSLATTVNGYATSASSAQTAAETAQGLAETAQAAAEAAEATAEALNNFQGLWSAQTGSAALPYSVSHNGDTYRLIAALGDVTTVEPGVTAGWGTYWEAITAIPTGGTTTTGDVTLTATSAAVLKATPTGYGFYATLPDATTITKGPGLYVIHNASPYPYGIKNNDGDKLGWVPGRQSCIVGLADKSATAGDWVHSNLSIYGITGLYQSFATTNFGTNFIALELDSDRVAILHRSANCYIQIFNHSTRSWGDPTLVRSTVSSSKTQFIKAATDKILVTSASTDDFEAVIVSVSGVTATPETGTKATKTLAASMGASGRMIQVGSSFVVPYYHSTQQKALAITVSDVTPSIGSETNIGSAVSAVPTLFVSSSTLRSVSVVTTTLTVEPAAVSGTTITPGTAATKTVTVTDFRAYQNTGGNLVIESINTNHQISISSLSGTTETISTATCGTGEVPVAMTDVVMQEIDATKTLVAHWDASAGEVEFNIITDSSGTASAGTPSEILATITTISAGIGITVSGTDGVMFFDTGGSGWVQITVDCSGSSPSVTGRAYNGDNASVAHPATTLSKYNTRNASDVATALGVLPIPAAASGYEKLVEFTRAGAVYHDNIGVLHGSQLNADTPTMGPGANSTLFSQTFSSQGLQLSLVEVAEV